MAAAIVSLGVAALLAGTPSTAGALREPRVATVVGRSRAVTATSTSAVPELKSVAWRAPVDGAVFAQPVIAGNRVFIATEDDDVYALSLHTGRLLWHASIGAPLTDVDEHAGCGDIDPLGVTSTPVVDAADQTLYVVGEVTNGARHPVVHRELVGFDVANGRVEREANADPIGAGPIDQISLQQRAGLVVSHGRVDVSYGGLDGDCGDYHGWVVGVSTTPGVRKIEFDTTPGGSGGAVWQGGAPPSVGSNGDLYVVTGNPNAQGTAGYYESVVKLSPELRPLASFRDRAAVDDSDFGTSTPLLVPGGMLFAVGKTDIGYVLRRSDLRLAARIPGVCGSDPDGRIAFDTATDAAYVPCRTGGIQEVLLRSDRVGWKSGTVNSGPILADGSLWALSYPGGLLQALDPVNGAIEQSTHIGECANFVTPAFGHGLLIVANATGEVLAFAR